MAAPAAAEVPVLAYLVVGLLALLSWVVLRGLAGAWRHTFGWLLERLGSILRIDVAFVHWHPGDALISLDHAFLHAITQGAEKSEHAAGYLFHGAAVIQEWATRELLHLATKTVHWAEWLQTVHLPKWIRAAIAVAVPPVLLARLIRAAVRAELPRITRTVHTVVHGATTVITQRIELPYLSQWQWIHRHWKGLTAAIATAGAGAVVGHFPWVHIFPRLRAIEREEIHVRRRLHRLERLLVASGLAVAMANVLGLPNWRCLTRGNIGRTARTLCGIPAHLLEDLLGLVVDFVVLSDICEVVTLLNDALEPVSPWIADFAGGVGAALCHGDYTEAIDFAPPELQVPALQARSAPQAA